MTNAKRLAPKGSCDNLNLNFHLVRNLNMLVHNKSLTHQPIEFLLCDLNPHSIFHHVNTPHRFVLSLPVLYFVLEGRFKKNRRFFLSSIMSTPPLIIYLLLTIYKGMYYSVTITCTTTRNMPIGNNLLLRLNQRHRTIAHHTVAYVFNFILIIGYITILRP